MWPQIINNIIFELEVTTVIVENISTGKTVNSDNNENTDNNDMYVCLYLMFIILDTSWFDTCGLMSCGCTITLSTIILIFILFLIWKFKSKYYLNWFYFYKYLCLMGYLIYRKPIMS